MTCCYVGRPEIPGADPDCFLCEGLGFDPTIENVTEACPVCMCDLDAVEYRRENPPEPYAYTDDDRDGILDGVTFAPARWVRGRYTEPITAIVMHRLHRGYHTAGPRYAQTTERHVSWHFAVHRPTFKRPVTQSAPINRRCWHAGKANPYSIGIEHDYPGSGGYTEQQMIASAELVRSLQQLLPHLKRVIAHSRLYPRTRSDPGRGFGWELFRALGLEVVK